MEYHLCNSFNEQTLASDVFSKKFVLFWDPLSSRVPAMAICLKECLALSFLKSYQCAINKILLKCYHCIIMRKSPMIVPYGERKIIQNKKAGLPRKIPAYVLDRANKVGEVFRHCNFGSSIVFFRSRSRLTLLRTKNWVNGSSFLKVLKYKNCVKLLFKSWVEQKFFFTSLHMIKKK